MKLERLAGSGDELCDVASNTVYLAIMCGLCFIYLLTLLIFVMLCYFIKAAYQ